MSDSPYILLYHCTATLRIHRLLAWWVV